MLLNHTNFSNEEYLAEWPKHYYDIQTGKKRKEVLSLAIEQGLDPSYDSYRINFCQKRFFENGSNGKIDSFWHAWTMIEASSASSVSLLTKKHMQKELATYAAEFCLTGEPLQNEKEQQVLQEEWADFSRFFIASCIGNKTYCSTLFGMVPMKDTMVAKKIKEEIDLVTLHYPAKFHMEHLFSPLRQVMLDAYASYFSM